MDRVLVVTSPIVGLKFVLLAKNVYLSSEFTLELATALTRSHPVGRAAECLESGSWPGSWSGRATTFACQFGGSWIAPDPSASRVAGAVAPAGGSCLTQRRIRAAAVGTAFPVVLLCFAAVVAQLCLICLGLIFRLAEWSFWSQTKGVQLVSQCVRTPRTQIVKGLRLVEMSLTALKITRFA